MLFLNMLGRKIGTNAFQNIGVIIMNPTSSKDLSKALATRLARHDISKEVISGLAEKLAKTGLKFGRLDFCPYGICIDTFVLEKIRLDPLVENFRYRGLKLFPYGILVDDLWRVQMEIAVPELNGAH
jgi:hypothetical protein